MTNLEPGRELDAWLAVHVLKVKVVMYRSESSGRQLWRLIIPGIVDLVDWTTPEGAWSAVPELSTTWEGMRLICDAMESRGWRMDELNGPRQMSGWGCCFRQIDEPYGWQRRYYQHAPGAVALAAKAAIGGGDAQD